MHACPAALLIRPALAALAAVLSRPQRRGHGLTSPDS